MGISKLTALEIFTNPNDLEITVGKRDVRGKYGLNIYRGPGDNFRPLLVADPFAERPEQAVDAVREILEAIHIAVLTELANPRSFASDAINPEGREIDEARILTPARIEKIVRELQKNQFASTYLADSKVN